MTRMDTAWSFRQAYEHARKIKEGQDDFCAKVTRGDWGGLGDYPEDLQWEALVDVLRGRVKVHAKLPVSESPGADTSQVHTHCYETVDIDDLVRVSGSGNLMALRNTHRDQITNEFKFSIAAFHHAHETYLVPETLKSAYGK